MLALDQPASGSSTDLAAPLRRIADLVRKRGLIVLVSDLLAPPETLEKPLALLAAGRHEVIVFQVLDPAELLFDFNRATRFVDVETGRDLFLDPALARDEYRRKLEEHGAAVQAICQRLGVACTKLSTAQPLGSALFDFLKARAERGKGSVRRKVAAA